MNCEAIYNAIQAYFHTVMFGMGDEAMHEAARKLRDLLTAELDASALSTPAEG
ncbi:hypothetical protein [Azospirillum sp. TSA6c]|uniref:hypothetical protein n=1 Tax=Azospirillum sp. TSA6c TaxID=709813 RepID=UPI001304B349|nr:hypothetical protein [Azospirillum sp. TSA6c]